MKEEEVVVVCDEIFKELNEKYKGQMKGKMLLYVSSGSDNPISMMDTAKVAVKHKDKSMLLFIY